METDFTLLHTSPGGSVALTESAKTDMGRQGVAAPNAVMIALKQLGITCATRGVSTCTCMYFLDNSTDADLLWIDHAPEQAYSLGQCPKVQS